MVAEHFNSDATNDKHVDGLWHVFLVSIHIFPAATITATTAAATTVPNVPTLISEG